MLTLIYTNNGTEIVNITVEHTRAFDLATHILQFIRFGDKLQLLWYGEEVASYDYLKLKELAPQTSV